MGGITCPKKYFNKYGDICTGESYPLRLVKEYKRSRATGNLNKNKISDVYINPFQTGRRLLQTIILIINRYPGN